MPIHVIHSPKHGDLRVVTWRDGEGEGRVWRAALDPRPARLAHVKWCEGTTQVEALEVMRATVERYEAAPAQRRPSALEAGAESQASGHEPTRCHHPAS